MKKLNLLLASTAILSAGAINVNATDTINTTLDSQVVLLQPTTIAQTGTSTISALNFGAIRMRAGDILKINPDSTIDDSVSTAEYISSSGKMFGEAGNLTISGGLAEHSN